MNKITPNLKRKMALTTGFSLIAMAVVAGVGYGYIFQSIYVTNNPSLTLLNLREFIFLFRLFIFLFVIVLILDIIVAWALYLFFKEDNPSLSLLTAWFRLVYSALLGVSFLSLLNVLQLLKETPQNSLQIMNQLNVFLDMWSLGLIVFACHLFFLGYLMLTSGYIPKFLGALTLLASMAYFFSNAANLLLPNYDFYKSTVEMVLSLPMALGELGIAIWLIIKGGRIK